MSDGIDAYRQALLAQAELAREDLDEIEDHLRELASELQSAGMTRAAAIAEACRRLGEPTAIAREHARVRSSYGARLSRARAWSAALLLLPGWLQFAILTLRHGGPGLTSMFGINLALATFALAGLVTRTGWARAMLVGALSWNLIERTALWSHAGILGGGTMFLVGAFVFLMPWRRGELAVSSYVVMLLAWAYHGVCAVTTYQLTRADQLPFVDPAATLACATTLLAGVGVITRARWTWMAAAASAVSLVIGFVNVRALHFRFADAAFMKVDILASIVCGVIAASLAALITWRRSRTTVARAT